MLKILVVEDKRHHIEDAKTFFEKVKLSSVKINVEYAATLNECRQKNLREIDGIISDINFPTTEGGREFENGFAVGEDALKLGIPIVFVTDINIHNKAHDQVEHVRKRYSMEPFYPSLSLVYSSPTIDIEGGSKKWPEAFVGLTYLIEAKKEGIIIITEQGIKRGKKAGYPFGIINLGGTAHKVRCDPPSPEDKWYYADYCKEVAECKKDFAFNKARDLYWKANIFKRLWF